MKGLVSAQKIGIQKVSYKIAKNCATFKLIDLGTVVNWLHILGFKVTETKKGVYFDGHER